MKINKFGNLEIERAGKWTIQHCPFHVSRFFESAGTYYRPCGGWCPLFGEPHTQAAEDLLSTISWLELCRANLEGEIIDERML